MAWSPTIGKKFYRKFGAYRKAVAKAAGVDGGIIRVAAASLGPFPSVKAKLAEALYPGRLQNLQVQCQGLREQNAAFAFELAQLKASSIAGMPDDIGNLNTPAQVTFIPKPARLWNGIYPDEKLLDRIKAVTLAEARIPDHEFLQFRRLQSLIYQLRVAGYDVEAMQTEALVGAVMFTYVNCKVAVTRCEYACEINAEVASKMAPRLPQDLIWLTTNANLAHDRIRALPLGITDYCGYSAYHGIIGDTEKLKQHIDGHPRTEKNLVLMNFNDGTYPVVREHVRSLFQGKDFVTADSYAADQAGYSRYVQGLRSHPFCLAPRGRGIETHRMWEALYAGCIPIVQREMALRDFEDLPILFVDRWEEALDTVRLMRIRDEYYQKTWDLRKLTLSHWYGYISKLVKERTFGAIAARDQNASS